MIPKIKNIRNYSACLITPIRVRRSLRVPTCRHKRIPLEGSLNGVDDRKGVLSDSGDVAPDAAENVCSPSTAKGTRDFLLNFCYPDIPF